MSKGKVPTKATCRQYHEHQSKAGFCASLHIFDGELRFVPGMLSQARMPVIGLAMLGYYNDEIAKRTFRSVDTVKTHLKGALSDLHAPTRFGLAYAAITAPEPYIRLTRPISPGWMRLFTNAERDVAGLGADGASTALIAHRYGRSDATVKTHIAEISARFPADDHAATRALHGTMMIMANPDFLYKPDDPAQEERLARAARVLIGQAPTPAPSGLHVLSALTA